MIGPWKKEDAESYFAEARKYFEDNPDEVKMTKYKNGYNKDLGKKDLANKGLLSFLKDKDGKIYAIDTMLLAQGSYGKVKRIFNQNGDSLVVKIQANNNLTDKGPILEIMKLIGFLKGQAVRQRVHKPFIGQLWIGDKHYSILSYIEGDELAKQIYQVDAQNQLIVDKWNYIRRSDALTQTQKLILAIKSCQAIKTLQDQFRIIHGDIKPENFIADICGNKIKVSVIDFEQAAILPKGKDSINISIPLTLKYAAPEAFDMYTNIGQFSFESDIYAIGKMMQEDLQLDSALYLDMLAQNSKNRPSLESVIYKLAAALAKETLDADAEQILAEVYDPQPLLDYANEINQSKRIRV